MNKEAEKKRLASIVFEGELGWVKWAAMDHNRVWFIYDRKPDLLKKYWDAIKMGSIVSSKNQPETELPWQETLLERKDYE